MSKFSWGEVIDRFALDLDGDVLEITKYHPHKYVDGRCTYKVDTDVIQFHSDEMSRSAGSLYGIILHYIAYKQLGLNQHALVHGICKALDINV